MPETLLTEAMQKNSK